MVLLLPFAIIIGIISVVLAVSFCVKCAACGTTALVAAIVLFSILFGVIITLGIIKTIKSKKPFYLVSLIIILLISATALLFQDKIIYFLSGELLSNMFTCRDMSRSAV